MQHPAQKANVILRFVSIMRYPQVISELITPFSWFLRECHLDGIMNVDELWGTL